MCYKELKLSTKPFQVIHFATFWSRCNILACEVCAGMRRKQDFKFLGIKVTQQSWLWLFAFLASFFFSCWALSTFHFGGKSFRKAFRILGLVERKGTPCRWVVEQDFHGNFQVNVTFFFFLFLRCPWLNYAHSGMVWNIPSLTAQVSGQSYPWPLNLMTSQAVERMRIRAGGYGQLRGEWVNLV